MEAGMNILILNGSPRKNGNTAHALKALKSGLGPRHRSEWIDVAALKLRGCIACEGCRKNGGNCVLPDGGAEFMDKVAAADMVLFGSPVYWWGISAQLKLALDKFYSKGEEFHHAGKKIGIVSVGEAGADNPEYRLISEQFRCIADYLGWEVVIDEKISACAVDDLAKDRAKLDALTQIGRNI
jgi:multimeric flavodoxin WrbA